MGGLHFKMGARPGGLMAGANSGAGHERKPVWAYMDMLQSMRSCVVAACRWGLWWGPKMWGSPQGKVIGGDTEGSPRDSK